MSRFVFFLFASIISVLVFACGSVGHGPCTVACANWALEVRSDTNDLVGVSGCGVNVGCDVGLTCNGIDFKPPAGGGSCTITVSFLDQPSATFTADWGAEHKGDCCTSYDHAPPVAQFHPSDGGVESGAGDGGLVAQCQSMAQHFATLCAGDDQRPCFWNAYAKLCATGKTQLLVDSMACLDQSTCRTFSDPNEAASCLATVHGSGESQASKNFVQNLCTTCGNPCPTIGGNAEIVPYLTDADVASLSSCVQSSCTIDALVQSCATIPDVAFFDVCEE